jgi:hypothetical protein
MIDIGLAESAAVGAAGALTLTGAEHTAEVCRGTPGEATPVAVALIEASDGLSGISLAWRPRFAEVAWTEVRK